LNRTTSLYLDLLRVLAAVGVFLGHANFSWFSVGLNLFPDLGHELVVLFFFLSGYVVADATLGKRRGPRDYAAARLSRLYSVVLPALVLTAVARAAGAALRPEYYAGFERGHESVRWALSAVFCQEVWFLSSSPATNAPLWSLGYEFWFYALFGCWVFVRRTAVRLACVVGVSLVAGPKLLLLLPVWLMGVAAWRARTAFAPPRWIARGGFVAASVAAWWLAASTWTSPGGAAAAAPWFYSGRWLSDWALGAAIALQVLCLAPAWPELAVPGWLERPVRWGAGLTFSLYAFHYPLLVFAGAVLPYDKGNALHVAAVLAVVLLVIGALWFVTERQRAWWRARFAALIARVAPEEVKA
jgi:peptidoglycan/LPS O-acetylase OafA/YrhL